MPLPFAAMAVPPPRPERHGALTRTDLLLVLMVVLWGVNFIVIKAAMAEFRPLAFNAVRFGLAAACVVALARSRSGARPPRALLPRFFLLGLLGNTIYQFAFIEGVARTRAGNAALIMAAVPVQTAIISHLRGHERLRWRDVLGLVVSTAGIAVIVLGSGKTVAFGGTIGGDLLVLAATVCWSVYAIGTKPLADTYGSFTVTGWTMGLGAIPLVLLSVPSLAAQDWAAIHPAAWAGLVFSALGALVVAYLIWTHGVRVIGPSRTALFSNFTPVVAMLAAWALLGETPTGWQVTGAGGIFTGIWLTRT